MRKKAFGIIFSALVVIVAAGGVLFLKNESEPVSSGKIGPVEVEGVGIPEGREVFSGVGTILELQAVNQSLECQVVSDQSGGAIEGTLFSDRGNIRTDFLVPAPEFGGAVLSSMIVGGGSMYVWSEIGGQLFGFKTSVTERRSDTIGTREPVSLDAQIRYTCSEWEVVDGSVFIPPANVPFQDVNTAIEAGMEYGTF